MRILNLRGIFTGDGFVKKNGRRPTREDLGFREGPIDIELRSGRIAKIGKLGPSGQDDFDASGLYATAAFVDSHTHAIFAGNRSYEFFQRWQGETYVQIAERGGGIQSTFNATATCDDDDLRNALRHHLEALSRGGCATVEVKSGYGSTPSEELRLLRLIKNVSQENGLPEVFATFLPLHALPKGQDEREFMLGMQALLPTIQKEKLAYFVDAFPEKGFFSLAISRELLAAAKKVGLRAKVHADEISCMTAAETFCADGALSVDHLQKISAAGVAALAQSDTVATLLPATSFYLGLEYTNARRLLAAGARVALATDFNPGTAPSASMPFTLFLAAAHYKMTPAEILCAATYNSAQALGLHDRGSLTVGARADLALWQADSTDVPEEIIALQREPRCVLSGGAFLRNGSK